MTSRLDLRNLCRRRLGDLTTPTHWSDLQINQWINDAVADYSLLFSTLRAVYLELTPRRDMSTFCRTTSVAVARWNIPPGKIHPSTCSAFPTRKPIFGSCPPAMTFCGGTTAAPASCG